jgi:putative transposase
MCVRDRRTDFTTDRIVFPLRDQLLQAGRDYRTEMIAYCFMPDHLHVLFEGETDHSKVLACAEMFRQRSGRDFRAMTGRYVWQEGFHDRILRREEDTLTVVRYILENPVRAGFCKDFRDYRYSGSARYSLNEIAGALA